MGCHYRTRLWRARHDAFWAAKFIRPGADIVVTDVCIPISRLAECVSQTKQDIERTGIIAPTFAHAGDGNFHANVLVMMDNPDEVARARAFIARVAERALAMEGTCTGEHGIGEGKKKFLVSEHGAKTVELMRVLKTAMDPAGISILAKCSKGQESLLVAMSLWCATFCLIEE